MKTWRGQATQRHKRENQSTKFIHTVRETGNKHREGERDKDNRKRERERETERERDRECITG